MEGGQDSCLAPGPNQQRHPRRTPPAAAPPGQSPQWTDTGGHDGLRAPRTDKAGKSHQPAVSPSRTRSEVAPKRSPPYPGIHHRVHNLSPADSSSGHAAPDSHHSGQIQAITTVALPRGQRGGLPWRPFRWAPREPRRLWAPREPRRLVIGADSKRKRLLHGGRTLCRRCSAGGGGGVASPETHHPPHPSLAQIFQQCIPRAPSLDFRPGL